MPTYEYICDACGAEFEKFQSIKADPIKTCPTCGKEQARRKISGGAAIIFKGGGFYETDYRSDSYNAAKKKDVEGASGATGDAKGGESKGSESKPEVKTDAAKPAASESSSKSESSKPAAAPAPVKPEKPAAAPKSE